MSFRPRSVFSWEGRRHLSPVGWVWADTSYCLEGMFSPGTGSLWVEVHRGPQQPSDAGGKEGLLKGSTGSPVPGDIPGWQDGLPVTAKKAMDARVYQCHPVRVIVAQVACETVGSSGVIHQGAL